MAEAPGWTKVEESAPGWKRIPDQFDKTKAAFEAQPPMSMGDKILGAGKALGSAVIAPLTPILHPIDTLKSVGEYIADPGSTARNNLNPQTANALPGAASSNPLPEAVGNFELAAGAAAHEVPAARQAVMKRMGVEEPAAAPKSSLGLVDAVKLVRALRNIKGKVADVALDAVLSHIEDIAKPPEAPVPPAEALAPTPSGPTPVGAKFARANPLVKRPAAVPAPGPVTPEMAQQASVPFTPEEQALADHVMAGVEPQPPAAPPVGSDYVMPEPAPPQPAGRPNVGDPRLATPPVLPPPTFPQPEAPPATEPPVTMYRGAETAELGKGQFGGTFLSRDKAAAAQYGPVHEYEVPAGLKVLDVDSPQAPGLAEKFAAKHPNDPGLANHDPEVLGPVPTDLFMFPTPKWVEFLKKQGYEGTSMGDDHFVFDQGNVRPKSAPPPAVNPGSTVNPPAPASTPAVRPADPSAALGAFGVDEPLVLNRAKVKALAKDNGISEWDQLKMLRDQGIKIQDDPFMTGETQRNRRGKVTSPEPMKPEAKPAAGETTAAEGETKPAEAEKLPTATEAEAAIRKQKMTELGNALGLSETPAAKPAKAKLTKAEIDKLPAKQAVEYLKGLKSGK